MKTVRRRSLVAFHLMVVGGFISGKAISQNIRYNSTTAGIQQAEGTAMDWGAVTGNLDLTNAVQSGTVEVRYGDPGDKNVSITVLPPSPISQDKPVIIIRQSDPISEGAAALHEYQHIKNNDPPAPGDNPTPAQCQANECAEAIAHCEVLQSFVAFSAYFDGQKKVPCALKNQVLDQLSWSQFSCNMGCGAYGPPGPPSCAGTSTVPCQ